MTRHVCMLVVGCAVVASAAAGVVRAEPGQAEPPAASAGELRAMLDQYCVTCHNERLQTAGLMLDKMDVDHIPTGAEVWEKVGRKLRFAAMPPPGRPRPDRAVVEGVVATLETALDRAAAAQPNPGRRTLHRLNRTEYGNVIRDLLALEIDVDSLLPPDDSSYGFDNIADVLKVSPSLLERYLSAARKISGVAVGDPSTPPMSVRYSVPPDLTQDNHLEGLPFGTRGGTIIHHTFPVDGEYVVTVKLGRTTWGTIRGMELVHQIDIRLDGQLVKRFDVGGIGRYGSQETRAHDVDAHVTVRLPVTAGPHEITVTFLKESYAQPERDLRKPFIKSNVNYGNVSGLPQVHRVFVEGPFEATGSGDTPSRRRIFVCSPARSADEASCAQEIISTLARRAYRRPATDAEVHDLLQFYEAKRSTSGFEAGIQMALRALLVQPEFLFRVEHDPLESPPGAVYAVSDPELASRLSFFLWSSIPDDELLTVAESGRLRDPAVLEQQVRRMLSDPRSQSLVNNFAAQWLYTRNMKAAFPNGALFPDFDDNVRQAMRRETELLFDSIVREDRSVLDLLTADYTFVNERLARHYGMPNVYGSHFRRVTAGAHERGGLLGQGSILTVTSYATRTSPVQRGKWILENILGAPPPDPPANVPPLPDPEIDATAPMRERMERHRASPACAACHAPMDPLGLALESFDGIGHGRVTRGESNAPIDVTGVMPDGTEFEGVAGLREVLLSRSDQFVETATEKLLTYALGRGVEYYDAPAVRTILREAALQDHAFSSIVLGIVKSTPFQMRKAADRPAAAGPLQQ